MPREWTHIIELKWKNSHSSSTDWCLISSHLDNQGKTVETELDEKNFKALARILADIYRMVWKLLTMGLQQSILIIRLEMKRKFTRIQICSGTCWKLNIFPWYWNLMIRVAANHLKQNETYYSQIEEVLIWYLLNIFNQAQILSKWRKMFPRRSSISIMFSPESFLKVHLLLNFC